MARTQIRIFRASVSYGVDEPPFNNSVFLRAAVKQSY